MRSMLLWALFLAVLPVAGCNDNVASGCLPEGCLATLSCDNPDCNRDADLDGVSAVLDCDDHDPLVYPGAPEACGNHKDDNCDGSPICDGGSMDADGDDYGSLASGGTDCDDTAAGIHPAVPDVCGDHVDNDCDGSIICDGGSVDADGDEYGSVATGGTDCDDASAARHPGALEHCGDTVDDDCDGSIICDGGGTDQDGDGYGSIDTGGTDCDDTNNAIHPGAVEDCLTGASEACGTDACSSGFVRLPLDSAAASALLEVADDLWLLGTSDGRVYRSVNGGLDWRLLGALAKGEVTRAVKVDAQTVAIGLRREDTNAVGVWLWTIGTDILTPGGNLTGLNGGEVTDIAVGSGSPFGLFVTTTGGGLYRSTDGGTSFTAVSGVDYFAYAVATDPADRTHLVVVTDMTVARSTDDAATFGVVMPEIPVVERLRAARFVTLDSGLYLLFDDGGAYLSPDFGQTFERVWTASAALAPRDLALSASTELALATRDRGLLRSTDAGAVWQPPPAPLGPGQLAVAAYDDAKFFLAGARGPILIDGDTSRRLGRGLDGADVRQVVLGQNGVITAAGGDGTLWVSIDHGAYFRPVETPAAGLMTAAWLPGARLIAVAIDGTILAGPAPLGPLSVVATTGDGPVTAAAFDVDDRIAVATGGLQSHLYVVDPASGATPTVTEVSGVPASVIDAATWPNGMLFIGTRSGMVLHQETDGGALLPATTPPTGGGITGLATTYPGGPVYATVGTPTGGLFISDDGGATFAAAATGTGSTWLRTICVDVDSGAMVLVGMDNIYSSLNPGSDWTPLASPPAGLHGDTLPIALSCTLEPGTGMRLWLPTLERGLWLTRLP